MAVSPLQQLTCDFGEIAPVLVPCSTAASCQTACLVWHCENCLQLSHYEAAFCRVEHLFGVYMFQIFAACTILGGSSKCSKSSRAPDLLQLPDMRRQYHVRPRRRAADERVPQQVTQVRPFVRMREAAQHARLQCTFHDILDIFQLDPCLDPFAVYHRRVAEVAGDPKEYIELRIRNLEMHAVRAQQMRPNLCKPMGGCNSPRHSTCICVAS